MKKIYFFAIAFATQFSVVAQTTIDFESVNLTPESYNNGADGSGGFQFGELFFTNYYDTTYLYNTGFSISNKSDDTTADFTNSHSAITASGFNSSNYAVMYGFGSIDLTGITAQSFDLVSVRLTNATYSALSMRDGDAYGKQFGSPNGADGNADGTNGEDFFKIIIHGIDINGDTLSTLEHYLADFRFADNNQDYILNTWELVDLTPLNSGAGKLSYLLFDFASSDVGMFGINTPTYFAMDDFTYDATVGLKENTEELKVYPNPFQNELIIDNGTGVASLFDLTGKSIWTKEVTGKTTISTATLSSGVYELIFVNGNSKSHIRLVK